MEKAINEIVDLASAYYGSAVLFAALECGVFAAVEQAGTLAEIAKLTKCSPRGLSLLLDACVAEGLLNKEGEIYANTAAGKLTLVPGGKADLTKAIKYNQDVYRAWGQLSAFVKTGLPVERPQLHLGENSRRTKAFAASMYARAMAIGRSVVPMLGALSGKVLDLAGGPGAYAILMCQANAQLKCETVDLPAISAEAAKFVAAAGLQERIACRAGDYHTDEYAAEAYEAVTIFGALHQESAEDIVAILKRAYRALKPGGKVFVLDMMTDETHVAPKFSALFGVNMALTTQHGWVFSDTELKGWLKEAGFAAGATNAVPPPMPHWLVTGMKM